MTTASAKTKTKTKSVTVSKSIPPVITPAKWKRMSERARLLAIAKDVLVQLDQRRIEIKRGDYVLGAEELYGMSKSIVRERLLTGKKLSDCTVCAIGAAWLSRIRLADSVYGDDVEGGYWQVRAEIGQEQAGLIESAFEMSFFTADYNSEQAERAIQFGERYSSDTTRLRKIMQNIVKNDGVFVP